MYRVNTLTENAASLGPMVSNSDYSRVFFNLKKATALKNTSDVSGTIRFYVQFGLVTNPYFSNIFGLHFRSKVGNGTLFVL